MGCGTGRLVPHPYLKGSTRTLNSHMVFTADVLSNSKQVTLYIPQVLSMDKSLINENWKKYIANGKHLHLMRGSLRTVLFELEDPEKKENVKTGVQVGKTWAENQNPGNSRLNSTHPAPDPTKLFCKNKHASCMGKGRLGEQIITIATTFHYPLKCTDCVFRSGLDSPLLKVTIDLPV